MTFEMKEVESSQIDAIGYDAALQKMRVVFKTNGKAYQYSNVPSIIYEDIMKAKSVGKEFNATVKAFPNTYPFVPE